MMRSRAIFVFAFALVACSSFSAASTSTPPDAGGDASSVPPSADASPVTDGAAPSAYRAAVLADAPIAYWRMGSSDAIVRDEVGSNDLVLQGGYTTGAAGAIGDGDHAVAFDGTTAFATAKDPRAFDFGNQAAFTIELWAKRRDDPAGADFQALFGSMEGSAGDRTGYQLYESRAGGSGFSTQGEYDDFSGSEAVASAAGLAPEVWTHVAYVFTGPATKQLVLYLAGAKVASNDITATTHLSKSDFVVGSESVTQYRFPGAIDEVAVYDKALDAATFAKHIAAAKAQ